LSDIEALLEGGPRTEFGWFCLVDYDQASHTFTLDSLLLPEQEVSSSTCELSPASLAKIQTGLFKEDTAAGIKPNDHRYRMNKMRGWFHSHVNMAVTPSSQDDAQIESFGSNNKWPYAIRGIVNLQMEMKIDVFWFERLTRFTDVPWQVVSDKVSVTKWSALAKERIKPLPARANSFDYSNSLRDWQYGVGAWSE
jgi:hypothetical protein